MDFKDKPMQSGKLQKNDNFNASNPDEYYFKVWETYENIAMHFNDLIIKLRIQSIGGVAALATILGIFLKEKGGVDYNSFNYCLAAIALTVLIIFWIAIYCLDIHYYNRLLEGAVNAILELEKKKDVFLKTKIINLSSNIENAFTLHFGHEHKGWLKRMFYGGRNCFYIFVGAGLLIPCVFCYCMWLKDTALFFYFKKFVCFIIHILYHNFSAT